MGCRLHFMSDGEVYEALDSTLSAAGIPMTLAELHGGLCGALCAGGADAVDDWVARSFTVSTSDPAALASLRKRFLALASDLSHALADFELGFEPYLPDEDEPLPVRVRALACWCQGFLAGLGLAGSEGAATVLARSGDSAEIVRDFAEIGKATVGEEQADEQAGFVFAEIAEYVRVGVQVVYEELAETRRSAANPPYAGTPH